ncbi:lysophospholipid acyltransferase family protein [Sphingomicrobium sp. XHP0235]|uniref:lysophospholipid acyltransferase family protein n=1 Tax=Sphingomicrobium aquimarinum TaxID=3133971 RepID=UPI0031FF3B9A
MESPSTATRIVDSGLIGLRVALLGLALLLIAPLHIVFRAVTGRGGIARFFLRVAGWILGVRTTRIGAHPGHRTLILANHVSWLDILVMGGSMGCAFVSKAEVQNHWLIKWLADQRETLYIDRQARREVDAQIAAVRRRFDHYLPLCLFPEGTTNDGTALKPFRSPLLKAVTPAPEGARLVPVALDYEDAADIAWFDGEPGTDNARKILTRRRPIDVTIHILEPIALVEDRKAMANEARRRIAAALELDLGASSPKGEA